MLNAIPFLIDIDIFGRVSADIVGSKVKHKSFGPGVITAIEVTNIVANFDKVGEKKLGYEVCMKNNLLQFI